MNMMCERVSAVFAGMVVGLWYAKTFPADDANKDKDKGGKDKNNKDKKK
ncbi:uncharacterized protein LOC115620152 [Scaptodrosophila lebanonensis]|uniref:Uncharacterized protein LOC115620152 n=1 Tax=Drosophila lebanonensis TaxID=7225 RepID=A0A6J2T2N1_DROLE|nr:uncharacterized protein LOC115620152 [Scaptodrosophila lebanonensis]